jgi:replication factor C subunit 1
MLAGSKEVPEGTPNCFGGLTFVFTGELESLGRDECTSIAKRYGG